MKKQLKKIIEETDNELKKYVAEYMLDELDEYNGTQKQQAQSWYNDLMRGGCQSGMIRSLIYYHDTHEFYDKFYDDIEELRLEIEQSIGESLKPEGDLKNWYAWLGFEETARKIADELGLEN